jgi:molybdopterin synthase sulfur carrier subunit
LAVKIRIPAPLRPLTEGKAEVEADGTTVAELIRELDRLYPGFAAKVCGPDGSVQRFLNVFVNDEDIRFLAGVDTSLRDGDEVSIIPAIAGG